MLRLRWGSYEVNSWKKNLPFESYVFINTKLYQLNRRNLQQVAWPEVESLMLNETIAHVIPLCHRLQRFLTVSKIGDLVDLLVIHHRGRCHVVRDFRVDMLIRQLIISRCGRVFRIEPSMKFPLRELSMTIPKSIFKVYDVFEECQAVLGKTAEHLAVKLVFTKGNQVVDDERILKQLARESGGRSMVQRDKYLYLNNNKITAFTIRGGSEPVINAETLLRVDPRQGMMQDFVRVFNPNSDLFLVVECDGVQEVDRYDRAKASWVRMNIINLE
ncbi:uncharacterized protein LOC111268247 isoform X1 [Varroa jacobsoni]|uniref:uncharacterized protein LOC111268247 isoform X1 n=1 Tax=Varroa jacobsoni TaxID=62625 RepID=UPI000BF530A6|nr:uncharacterized protein LOC111268247 isoform X1 [Varroa jacobsoni]